MSCDSIHLKKKKLINIFIIYIKKLKHEIFSKPEYKFNLIMSSSSSSSKNSKMPFLTFLILIFLLLLAFLSIMLSTGLFNSYDDKTNSYDEIKKSLINGNKLRMVMHFDKMDLYINGKKYLAPKKISGFEIDQFEFVNTTLIGGKSNSLISILNAHVVDDSEFGLVNTNVKTSLYQNDSILIKMTYMSIDNSKIMREETFNSSLKLGALYFFNQSPAKFTFEDNLGNRKSIF